MDGGPCTFEVAHEQDSHRTRDAGTLDVLGRPCEARHRRDAGLQTTRGHRMRVVITVMATLLAACTASAPTARPTVTRGAIIGETSASPTRAASPTDAGRRRAPTASGVGGRSGNTEGCTPDFWKDH